MKKWFMVGVIVYLVAIGAIYLDGALSQTQPSRFAVVLGNQVMPSGEPSMRLQARLGRALALYQAGIVRQIIVSGGVGREGFDEAVVMKAWLQQQGMPGAAIITDSDGYNTRKTANNALQWVKPEEPVIVVSQLYHVSRSKLAFRQAGFEQVGGAYPQYFERRDFYASLRAVPAWLKYFLLG